MSHEICILIVLIYGKRDIVLILVKMTLCLAISMYTHLFHSSQRIASDSVYCKPMLIVIRVVPKHRSKCCTFGLI